MRIVIVGQSWLGAETLKLCVELKHTVLKAITPSFNDRLAREAFDYCVPIHAEGGCVSADLIPKNTDLIVAAHAHAFISAEARGRAKYGAIGYHPSLLPRHRGRDAVRWTIHMGDSIAGGSVYWMEDGADTGAIAAQAFCHVLPSDTPESLWRRELAPMGLRLLGEVISDVAQGVVKAQAQDERAATWEPAFNRPVLKAL